MGIFHVLVSSHALFFYIPVVNIYTSPKSFQTPNSYQGQFLKLQPDGDQQPYKRGDTEKPDE